MIDIKKVGECISTLRKEQNLTQKQLAECLNISPQAVSKWENGLALPDTVLLVELAKLLQITVDDLLQGEKKATVSKNYASTKENIAAHEIMEEIRSGRDIYISDAVIEGDLIFTHTAENRNNRRTSFIQRVTRYIFKGLKVEKEHPSHINGRVQFENCIFRGKIIGTEKIGNIIYMAIFHQNLSFNHCHFERAVDFKHSKFHKRTTFNETKFDQLVNFKYATFSKEAIFNSSKFNHLADFKYTKFKEMASFQYSQFQAEAIFKYVNCLNINFEHAYFVGVADFKYAAFPKQISFGNCIFQSAANFKFAKLRRNSLHDVTFKGYTDFKYTSYM